MTNDDEESIEERVERDAYALAQLIYDIYQEQEVRHRSSIDIQETIS